MSDKGEYAIRPGDGPKVTRMVNGRLVVQYLKKKSDLEEIEELAEGIPDEGIRGGSSGFGKFSASMGGHRNEASQPLTSIPGGERYYDLPESDILMQPDTDVPREEGDFVDTDAPKRRNETDQDGDLEDHWDMDFYEETNDRDQESGHGGPMTFDRDPGSKRPRATASLDDEIDDLFK